jgi:hypothetical protein
MQSEIKARRKKYPAQVAALLCMQGLGKYKCLHVIKLKDHFFLPSFLREAPWNRMERIFNLCISSRGT